MKKIAAFVLVMMVMPFIVLAHPGHGDTDGYTIIHYFTEPVHAITTFTILISSVAYLMYKRKAGENK